MIIQDEDAEWNLEQQVARLQQPVDFHGAAILDADGNEIPITEDMIRSACECLDEVWQFPRCCSEPLVTPELVAAFDAHDPDATSRFYRPPDLSPDPKT